MVNCGCHLDTSGKKKPWLKTHIHDLWEYPLCVFFIATCWQRAWPTVDSAIPSQVGPGCVRMVAEQPE